jgi:hypothetical protein
MLRTGGSQKPETTETKALRKRKMELKNLLDTGGDEAQRTAWREELATIRAQMNEAFDTVPWLTLTPEEVEVIMAMRKAAKIPL